MNDTILYEAANSINAINTEIDVRVGTISLDMAIYEGENATLTNCTVGTCYDASNGEEVDCIAIEKSGY